MHTGRLDTDSAAGRVYRYLKQHKGCWVDAWTLTVETGTTAISTRISEVRHQLNEKQIPEAIETRQDANRRWYYRLMNSQNKDGMSPLDF